MESLGQKTKTPRKVMAIGCLVAVLSLSIFVYRIGAVTCTPSGTNTSILQLCKPASGETGWAAAINANWDFLDGLFNAGNILKVANGGTGLASPGTSGNVLTSNGTAWVSSAGGGGGASLPTGGVIMWSTSTAPTGFLLCNGAAVSRTTYATLFALIGTTYGTGDGSTTFNLPDMRSRVAVGAGQGTGLTNRVLAAKAGEEAHTLTVPELASHVHQETANVPGGGGTVPANYSASGPGGTALNSILNGGDSVNNITGSLDTQAAGSGTAHNIMQPYLVLNFIIKT